MALNIEIRMFQICDVHRLSSKPGKNRLIIVEFSAVFLMMEIFHCVRICSKNIFPTAKLTTEMISIKGESSPIYISEYLAGATRKLIYLRREYAQVSDYKFCWAING